MYVSFGRGQQKPPLGTRIDWSHPLAQGLALCLPLTEGGGGSVFDLCRDVGYATPAGTTWTAQAALGAALHFPGNAGIRTTYTTQLADFTACVWYLDSTLLGNERLLDKHATAGFWLGRGGIGSQETVGGGCLMSTTPYGIFVSVDNALPHLLVGSRQGNQWTIWVDGIAQRSTTVSTALISADSLCLGANTINNTSQPFNGIMSGVLLYSRALSAAEVAWLYAEPWAMYERARVPVYYSIPAGVGALFRRTAGLRAGSRGVFAGG